MVTLKPMTREMCHEFYKEFQNDPAIGHYYEYVYSEETADRYYDVNSVSDRRLFAIFAEGRIVGECKLKNIDYDKGECSMGIHLQNDSAKGKGYGTLAERLILRYAFEELGMTAVNADAAVKNTRSQHVLEKVGFRYIREDEMFKYYRCDRVSRIRSGEANVPSLDWRTIKKTDAHIHILPDEVHKANPDSEDVWLLTNLHQYVTMMEERNIEKAVLMPLNDPWLMSMEFTVDAVHRNLAGMKRTYPGRFYAFGDVDCRNTPEESVAAIKKAIEEYGLDGIKLHPNNSGVALEDAYNGPIFSYARQRRIPVAIHCYPNSETDLCTAGQIRKIAEKYPGLTLIVCHMGAHQWEQLQQTGVYADISAILPEYVRAYGIKETNRILRKFGVERLLFATDYPDSRILQPGEIYDEYYRVLDQMDFTREEAEKIAGGNLERILNSHDTV